MAFALGVMGAALVAAIVVSLAAAWAFAEISGARGSLNERARRAPVFYSAYFVSVGLATVVTLVCGPTVPLSIAIEVGNSLLLPVVLAFLLALAWKALPPPYRLSPARSLAIVAVIVSVLALNICLGLHTVGL